MEGRGPRLALGWGLIVFGALNFVTWTTLGAMIGVFEQAWDVVLEMGLLAFLGLLALGGGLRMVRGARHSATPH
jgi:hypothetical protein